MCGRYFILWEADEEPDPEMRALFNEINERYRNTLLHAEIAIGEVRPTNVAPVITGDGAHLMHWGFPKWDGNGVVINARSETVGQKAMFRQSIVTRRCVVPSYGFFEWSHGPGRKKKYLCRLTGMPLLMMAGIYNTFTDARGNETENYVILTTEANGSVAPIHDRMPVILQPEEQEAWLSDKRAAVEILRREGPELELEET